MKEFAPRWTALLALLVSATLVTSSSREAFGQDRAQVLAADNALQIAKDRDAAIQLTMKNTKINTSSRAKFSESSATGWAWVQTQCTNAQSDQCSAAAIMMASNQCTASAKFLKKDAKSWQYLSFSLLLASAAFTGLGAASTIAGSTTVPKVFSTLGGTTGLGAVVSSANANVSTDQTGLVSINTTLNQFITYVTTGGTKGAAGVPAFASGLSASGTQGVPFSYQIEATNSPTSYLVTDLPAGLSASAATGMISGTPTSSGAFTVSLAATNATGTSSNATLTLNIAASAPAAVPQINSAVSASGTVANQFGYQIAATNSPTGYSVAAGTTLPAGLTLNATTGVISGTPAAAATTPVTLTATNAVGVSNPFTLTFTIAPAPAAGNGPAPNDLIYKVASLYGTQCAATAMASK
jgi:hypothetical protein